MRIALIGADGQLGTALQARLKHEVVPLRHTQIEITNAESVQSALAESSPDVVINAAAYNFVDLAEDEPDAAYAANALGPRNLARYCAEKGIVLLHVSTDFVFGLDTNRTTPYRETDAPGPMSSYAVSKLAGEQFVLSLAPKSFVVRTCGLYGRRSPGSKAGKGNFVETMLRLAGEREFLTVVDDQTCTPTYVADLAEALAALIDTQAYGLYHATNSGGTSWCGFAREILRQVGSSKEVRPISSSQFAAKARRPGYSVLDCGKLAAAAGYTFRPWQEGLAEYLSVRAEPA